MNNERSLAKEITEGFEALKSMRNNEPVAWIGETLMGRQYINGQKDELPVGTALYTHPAELTDEEIIKVYEDMLGVASAKGSAIDFARAILRKAQQK